MKRVLYTLGVALALASCGSNEYEDWAAPQSNAEESATTISFTATPAAAIDFNKVTTDSVALFTPKVTTTATVATQGLTATLFSADKSSSVVLAALLVLLVMLKLVNYKKQLKLCMVRVMLFVL